MAHVGQEIGFGAAGFLGGFLRDAQHVLVGFALPDEVFEQAGDLEDVVEFALGGAIREVQGLHRRAQFAEDLLITGVLRLEFGDGFAEFDRAEGHGAIDELAVGVLLDVSLLHGVHEAGETGHVRQLRAKVFAELARE